MLKHKGRKPQHKARDFSAKEERLIALAGAKGCEVWELDSADIVSSSDEESEEGQEGEESEGETLEEEKGQAVEDPDDPLTQANTNRQRRRTKKKVEEPVQILEEDVKRLADVRREREEAAKEREEQKQRAEELRKQAAEAYVKKGTKGKGGKKKGKQLK
jgi:hypothetical protein